MTPEVGGIARKETVQAWSRDERCSCSGEEDVIMAKLDVFKVCSGGVGGGLCSILRNHCS